MGRQRATGTPATATLQEAGVPHTLHSYAHDPRAESFGLQAASALGVEPARVYKTLLVDTGDSLAVGVVPVTCSLDLKAMALALGAKKVGMANPASAERSSGMVVGGISPIGQKRPLPTVLDHTMHEHATVLVSGGRRGLDVELAPSDLARLTGATFASISRP
ncbi:MAG: Cys-tRNA(Pro) deacylase [Arachnia sp.]